MSLRWNRNIHVATMPAVFCSSTRWLPVTFLKSHSYAYLSKYFCSCDAKTRDSSAYRKQYVDNKCTSAFQSVRLSR